MCWYEEEEGQHTDPEDLTAAGADEGEGEVGVVSAAMSQGSQVVEGGQARDEVGTSELVREVVLVTDFECWQDPQTLISALAKDQKR